MNRTEVSVRGIRVGRLTLLECSRCGPVAVTDDPAAAKDHLDTHTED